MGELNKVSNTTMRLILDITPHVRVGVYSVSHDWHSLFRVVYLSSSMTSVNRCMHWPSLSEVLKTLWKFLEISGNFTKFPEIYFS